MKFLIWAITGFLVLLWTGAAAMLAAAVNWLAGSIADPAIRNVPSPAQWPVPEWLAVWMPPAIIEQLRTGLAAPLDGARLASLRSQRKHIRTPKDTHDAHTRRTHATRRMAATAASDTAHC